MLIKIVSLVKVKSKKSGKLDTTETDGNITLSTIFDLIIPWLVECNRAVSKHNALNALNDMHAVGLGMCAILYLYEIPIPLPDKSLTSIFITGQDISVMSLRDLQLFVGNLQLQFMSLYTLQSNGICAQFDITCTMLHIMQRIGFWTCNDFETISADKHLKELANINGDYLEVRFEEVQSLLDVIHTMLGTHRLLVNAKYITAPYHVELFPHHREASTETWWEISIVTDCPIGSIIQYKNKFHALFHSVSQVVYFHYPSYSRQRQLALEEITSTDARWVHDKIHDNNPMDTAKHTKYLLDCQINILPLLLQVEPDVALLYEHTGAGHRPTMAKKAWNWVILGRFVLLIDRDMNVYTASDLRSLLAVVRKGDLVVT